MERKNRVAVKIENIKPHKHHKSLSYKKQRHSKDLTVSAGKNGRDHMWRRTASKESSRIPKTTVS